MPKKENAFSEKKYCKNCVHVGFYMDYYACYKGNFLKIIFGGPTIVKYDDCCKDFKGIIEIKKNKISQKTR